MCYLDLVMWYFLRRLPNLVLRIGAEVVFLDSVLKCRTCVSMSPRIDLTAPF